MKADYHLHYVIRSLDEVAFEADITTLGSNVTIYCKKEGNPLKNYQIFSNKRTVTPTFTAALDNG